MITGHVKPLILALALCALSGLAQDGSFCNLLRSPDALSVVTETGKFELTPTGGQQWSGGGVTLTTRTRGTEDVRFAW